MQVVELALTIMQLLAALANLLSSLLSAVLTIWGIVLLLKKTKNRRRSFRG